MIGWELPNSPICLFVCFACVHIEFDVKRRQAGQSAKAEEKIISHINRNYAFTVYSRFGKDPRCIILGTDTTRSSLDHEHVPGSIVIVWTIREQPIPNTDA